MTDTPQASAASNPQAVLLVEHYFRHEYGRLVSTLARVFGFHRVDVVEDGVQAAMMSALTAWAQNGQPADPSGWLYRAAHNQVLDALRRGAVRSKSAPALQREAEAHGESLPPDSHFPREIADDQLRMLFVCCDDAIPRESQLVIALKTLCGFSTGEIARRLFISEENVHKRLARARARLREMNVVTETPALETLRDRIENVHMVLYLLFNEGYNSADSDSLIRRELCEEAIRLCVILAEHPLVGTATTRALLALMFLHSARFDARLDGSGAMLLLEEQDRGLWDRELITIGTDWLARSAEGDTFSRYHIEAAIAAEHCFAPTFEQTNWEEIVSLYEALDRIAPSPLHVMNRAIAVAHARGAESGLEILRSVVPPAWLAGFYLWDAVLGELEKRAGNLDQARRHLQRALESAPTEPERTLLRRRLSDLRSFSAK